MNKNHNEKHIPGGLTAGKPENDLPGYPSYPESDDIFSKFLEEKDVNPEDPSTTKLLNAESANTKDFNMDNSGADLDVPGSELDDEMEEIGSEDEENNYYSLGGDNHTDLDEN
jgi:hypothetical protein